MFEQRVGRASPVSDIDCKPHGAVKRVAAWNLHYDVTVTLCSGVTRLTAHTHTHLFESSACTFGTSRFTAHNYSSYYKRLVNR